jgi:hypothetical protein
VKVRLRRIRWGWVIALVLAGGFGLGLWLFGTRVLTLSVWLSVPGGLVSLVVSNARRGARMSVWSVITFLVASCCYSWIFTSGAHWYFKMLLLVVPGAPLASIANAAYGADGRRAQATRDLAATELENHLANGEVDIGRYALYLRPFATTDRLEAQSLGTPVDTPGEIPVHVDLESLLTRAVRKECPLVALGREGEMHEGAGRITVPDESWQTSITRLASHAAILLIVPSAHSGTLWELKQLEDRKLLSKTLMLMPEQPRTTPSGVWRATEDDGPFEVGIKSYNPSDHTYDISDEWARAVEASQNMSLHLPAYSPAGALFTIDPASRCVNRIVPLALSVLTRKIRYLRAVLSHLGLSTWREPRSTSFGDDFEAAVFGGGRTLEYALLVAADAFLAWGRVTDAQDFLRRAISVCRHPQRSIEYIRWAEQHGYDSAKSGDASGALPYLETVFELRKEIGMQPSEQQLLEKEILLCSQGTHSSSDC